MGVTFDADSSEWLGVLEPKMQSFSERPNVPIYRVSSMPEKGDLIIAGMYITAAGTLAVVEQEHKFGIIDFKVSFHRISTKEYSCKRHETLRAAMKDFCNELMLDNPMISLPKTRTLQEQYSDDTGFGKWA